MKLRDKHCHANFFLYHPGTGLAYEAPPPTHLLSPYQFTKHYQRPWVAVQYAHYLAALFSIDGIRPEVYAYVSFYYFVNFVLIDFFQCTCQLNYRERQQHIDPTVNLAGIDKWTPTYEYVTELKPLGEEVYDQYPWNWEWNFNWLYGINDGSNFDKLAKESEEMDYDNSEDTYANRQAFIKWIGERERIPSVKLHELTPPTPTNEVGAYFWQYRAQEIVGGSLEEEYEVKSDMQNTITIKSMDEL